MNKIDELLDYQKQSRKLETLSNILYWELMTKVPEDAKDEYIELINQYSTQLFERQTSIEYGQLLNDVITSSEFKKLSLPQQKYIELLSKDYQKDKKIPSSFYSEHLKLMNETNIIWQKAKEENNYNLYKPYLAKLIESTKQYYRYIDNNTSDLYSLMLEDFQPGMNSQIIDKLFEEIKTSITPIIPQVEHKKIKWNKRYSKDQLVECAHFLLNYIGFDLKRGTLGIYTHPFTESLTHNDVRIAFNPDEDLFAFIGTIIHEGGHGIFDQNVDQELIKYGFHSVPHIFDVHESQSRFFENILGRNINFWKPIYKEFSELMNIDLSLEDFVAGLNQVKPGLIRTAADELTYPFHIILRYEIERDIFNGDLSVDEIPKVWNQKMKEYLGVDVQNDNEGLMQDVHWSDGSYGYFSSYLLGSIYDGMFIQVIERDLGNIDEILSSGNIKKITQYLNNNVHKYAWGSNAVDIISQLTDQEISAQPIIDYLKNKYVGREVNEASRRSNN